MIAVAVGLLLGVFLPPNINGTRFRESLRPALSAALGRQVTIGQVKYRLLPRPGFDLYDFQVADDRAFSAEPLLMCGKVTADLRLTSLWQGRLEIADLKLTDDSTPPSLNLVYVNGHWNVESLLLRVGQVPTAPTARRRAEQRPRFPYIEATSGRINLKIGPEKKPYALTNTDFAFWLAAEDVWHLRLEGHPVRTDLNLNDTGTVKLEGDLRRSPSVAETPVQLSLSWEKTQLGQFSSLLLGHDPGWRGDLRGEAQLSGTPANLHVTAEARLGHFRRYDINRDSMPELLTRCLGDSIHGTLDLKCDTALGTGGLLLSGRWSAATPRDYDLSLVANHLPLALVATFARHARRSLPDDLTATGDVNAAFGFHSHNRDKNWHGTGMSSPFLLQTAAAGHPFPVGQVKFHMGAADNTGAPPTKTMRRMATTPIRPVTRPEALTVDTFSILLDSTATLDVQASVDGSGYSIVARGMVPIERLLALGRATGFQAPTTAFTASATVDFNISNPWGSANPPRVHGSAGLQNVVASIPGLKSRLLLSRATAQLTDASLQISNIDGQFEHTPVAFGGAVTVPWSCPNGPPCPLEFELHADALDAADLAALLIAGDKGWSLPFFDDSPARLPDVRGRGAISVDRLTLAQLPLEKFTGRVETGDHTMTISHATAKLGGGSVSGDWKGDWTGAVPRFTISGSVTGVALDHLGANAPGADLLDSWLTGKIDGKYYVRFEGTTSQERLASANGQAEFTVASASSRRLLLDGYSQFKLSGLHGTLEIDKQTLRLLPSKFRSDNRIYELGGTVALADRQARLKVSSGASQWEITGALDKPRINLQPMAAQTTSAHPQ